MIENNVPPADDWRRQGQERYLKGLKLVLRDYSPYKTDWEHDHCEFCGKKFSLNEGDVNFGYSTEDGYHWICSECFGDFNSEFGWTVVNHLNGRTILDTVK